MPKYIALFIYLCLLFISGTLLLACDSNPKASTALRVGYAIEKPYAYLDANGDLTGYAIESTKILAGQLGFKDIIWVQIPFPSLIDSLINKRVDIVSAGMFITPEREELIAFSIPFVNVDSAFLASTKTRLRLLSEKNKASPIKVAVLENSVEAQILEQLRMSDIEIITTPDSFAAIATLRTTRTDAIFLSIPSLLSIQSDMSDTHQIIPADRILGRNVSNKVGFGFHLENDKLLSRWNAVAKAWMNSRQHQQLLENFNLYNNIP